MRNVVHSLWFIFILATIAIGIPVFQIMQEEKTFGKLFRRGRGVSNQELVKLGCLRVEPTIFSFDHHLKDARLSPSQRMDMLRDVYTDDAICPFSKDGQHGTEQPKVITLGTITPSVLMNKASNRLTPEELSLIIHAFPPYRFEEYFFKWLALRDKESPIDDWFSIVTYIMRNPHFTYDGFILTFELLVDEIDSVLSSKKPDETFSPTVQRSIRNLIDSSHFTDNDIMALCYDKRRWLRDIVGTCKRCSEDAKVAIALNNGASTLISEV